MSNIDRYTQFITEQNKNGSDEFYTHDVESGEAKKHPSLRAAKDHAYKVGYYGHSGDDYKDLVVHHATNGKIKHMYYYDGENTNKWVKTDNNKGKSPTGKLAFDF